MATEGDEVFTIKINTGVVQLPEMVARIKRSSELAGMLALQGYRLEWVDDAMPSGVIAETGFYRDGGEWIGLGRWMGEESRSFWSRLVAAA